MGHLDWTEILVNAAVMVASQVPIWFWGYRQLAWTLREYRPHTHVEREGALHVTGVIYPRTYNGNAREATR